MGEIGKKEDPSLTVAMLIAQALAGPRGGFSLPFSVDLPTEAAEERTHPRNTSWVRGV